MILSNVERLLLLYFSKTDCLDFPAFSIPKTKNNTEIFGVITTQLKNQSQTLRGNNHNYFQMMANPVSCRFRVFRCGLLMINNGFEMQTYIELNDV